MRILSFVFLFIFAVNISAQTMKVDDLFTLGTKQINAGRFDDALTTYKTALATAENKYAGKEYLARLHYNIGLCYFHLDRFDARRHQTAHKFSLHVGRHNAGLVLQSVAGTDFNERHLLGCLRKGSKGHRHLPGNRLL